MSHFPTTPLFLRICREDVTQNGTFSLSKLVDICRTVVLVVLCQIMYNVNNNYNANAKI